MSVNAGYNTLLSGVNGQCYTSECEGKARKTALALHEQTFI